MDDLCCEQFFRKPCQHQQRHYEALRAFFLDRRPLLDIARQFGFAHGTLRNLVSRFRARCQAGQVPPFSFPLHAVDPPPPVPVTLLRVPTLQLLPIAAGSPWLRSVPSARVSPGLSCSCLCWLRSASTVSSTPPAIRARE
jgi:hypothetical protein